MTKRVIRFGVIGCGLMGREFASAVGRWRHLLDLDFEPQITAACNRGEGPLDWFRGCVPELSLATREYRRLLESPDVEAVYIAVPHNQHEEIYRAAIQAGKHILGEKPFGIDLAANRAILAELARHPELLVRCSSEFPFFPGAYRIAQWMHEGRFGRIIDVEAGFWHSSDLDPNKPLNWKRQTRTCGAYGCMGDLGLHVAHLPFRAGWYPGNVRAFLSKIFTQRPDKNGQMALCDTWDNALLACEAASEGWTFPLQLSMKRIAPGHANTWFLRINGTLGAAEFSTQNPKQLRFLWYSPDAKTGEGQAWRTLDMPYQSAYPTITGPIFEFGFGDAILQMWAAFCDELVHGREGMRQLFFCATPEETTLSHQLFSAALESNRESSVVSLNSVDG